MVLRTAWRILVMGPLRAVRTSSELMVMALGSLSPEWAMSNPLTSMVSISGRGVALPI